MSEDDDPANEFKGILHLFLPNTTCLVRVE